MTFYKILLVPSDVEFNLYVLFYVFLKCVRKNLHLKNKRQVKNCGNFCGVFFLKKRKIWEIPFDARLKCAQTGFFGLLK